MSVADSELRDEVLKLMSTERLMNEIKTRGHFVPALFGELSAERSKEWDARGTAGTFDVCYLGLAMGGEAGEAQNMIKKLLRRRAGLATKNTEADLIKEIAKELADVYIYLDLIASGLSIDLGQAIIDKFNEVSVREGFEQRY